MKYTKIALALAVMASAQNASAFDVYVSGASALRNTVGTMMNRFCQTTGFVQRGTGNQRVYSCTFHTETTSPAVGAELAAEGLAGANIRVFHSVIPGVAANSLNDLVGGSITGIIPLLPNASSSLVKFANDNATTTGSVIPETNTFYAAPHIGFSDVEPSKFTADYGNLPTNAAAVAAGWVVGGDNPADLVSTPAFAQGFGVLISNNARTAGLTNLSETQLAEILAGNVTNINQLSKADGSAITTSLPIRVCRRTNGSGTQATFNQLVSRLGCGANLGGVTYSVASQGPTAGGDVVENAASSGVATCVNTVPSTMAAIGIIGLDTNGVQTGSQFADINGIHIWDANTAVDVNDGNATIAGVAAPDRVLEEKIVSGAYPLYVESHVVKSAKVTLTAEQEAFYNLIANRAGDPLFTKTFAGIVSLPSKRALNATQDGYLFPNNTLSATNYTRNGDTCNPSKFAQ